MPPVIGVFDSDGLTVLCELHKILPAPIWRFRAEDAMLDRLAARAVMLRIRWKSFAA